MQVRVRTPNYELFGPTAVDVKVCISGEGWTVNKVRYSYFANTAARNCLAFGPGLLEKGVFGVEMPLIIQAHDTFNERRTSGGDHFTVRVVSADGKMEGAVRHEDLGDGQYMVHYAVPAPGRWLVHISHDDLGGPERVAIRGTLGPIGWLLDQSLLTDRFWMPARLLNEYQCLHFLAVNLGGGC